MRFECGLGRNPRETRRTPHPHPTPAPPEGFSHQYIIANLMMEFEYIICICKYKCKCLQIFHPLFLHSGLVHCLLTICNEVQNNANKDFLNIHLIHVHYLVASFMGNISVYCPPKSEMKFLPLSVRIALCVTFVPTNFRSSCNSFPVPAGFSYHNVEPIGTHGDTGRTCETSH